MVWTGEEKGWEAGQGMKILLYVWAISLCKKQGLWRYIYPLAVHIHNARKKINIGMEKNCLL